MWKRRIERARELKLTTPDPCILLGALDAITFNAVKKAARKMFRINSAREAVGADITTTNEVVDQMTLLPEGELEDSVASTWSTVAPKVKSLKGTPKGDKGKGG